MRRIVYFCKREEPFAKLGILTAVMTKNQVFPYGDLFCKWLPTFRSVACRHLPGETIRAALFLDWLTLKMKALWSF